MKPLLTKGKLDVFATILAIILSFFLLVVLDGFEAIYALTRRYEDWELDEAILIVFALPLPLAWLAYRQGKAAISAARQKLQAEQKLAHYRKVESLGVLAGGLAHELNNQLVPVLSLSESLLENTPPDHKDRRKLELIFESVTRSKETVSKILAFARREAGEKGSCEVSQVVRNLLPMLRLSCPSRITFSAEIGDEVGTVALSPTEVESIVVNLFNNAIHSMQDSGGRLALICRRVSGTDPLVEIRVEDEGGGMNKDHASKAFEPFFTTKEIGDGIGLGLAYAQGVLNSIGGEITLNSELGKGTKAVVRIPVQESV